MLRNQVLINHRGRMHKKNIQKGVNNNNNNNQCQNNSAKKTNQKNPKSEAL